jgi:ZipA, C-terminal FtsZ-binding domain
MSSFQLSLLGLGALVLVAVWGFNGWTSRRSRPRQAEVLEQSLEHSASVDEVLETDVAVDPVLEDDFSHLPLPERKPSLDPLIDVVASVEVDGPVSGDAALAAMPSTRRVGSKAFFAEGISESSGHLEPLLPGHRYTGFQVGIQLANRLGALNEIEFSEFVVKSQAFADAINASVDFPDMLEEVARARELDQFASAHDAQLSLTLHARSSAWSPGYVQQHAARHGFVAGTMPGRMVLPSPVQGLPPVLALSFDMQAALADDPDMSAVRAVVLSLDVPQVSREEQPFERLCQVAQTLSADMDAVLTDGANNTLSDEALAQIGVELQGLYNALDERELSAGSAQARRLFS